MIAPGLLFKNSRAGTMLLIASVTLLAGCESGPEQKQIFPPKAATLVKSTGKSIRVEHVTGGRTTHWYESWIENDKFQSSLEEALEESGLFARVERQTGADYRISADIKSQEVTLEGDAQHNAITLKVEYRLVEQSGTLIWTGEKSSSFYLGFESVFGGAARRRKLQEQAIRMNLAQMMDDISLTLGARR